MNELDELRKQIDAIDKELAGLFLKRMAVTQKVGPEMVFGGALDLDAIWQFFDGIAPEMGEAQKDRIKKYTQRNGNRAQRRALRK